MKFSHTLAWTAIALASNAFAIQNVSLVGRYLYTADGNRFYIKGVAYQEMGMSTASATSLPINALIVVGTLSNDPNDSFPEPSTFIDPLADPNTCNRDLPFLQQLGVNAIRAYSVDATLNHDQCMQTFSGAGIYVMYVLALTFLQFLES